MNHQNPTLTDLTDLLAPEDLERVNDWILHGSALHRIQQWIYEEFDLTVAFAAVLEYEPWREKRGIEWAVFTCLLMEVG